MRRLWAVLTPAVVLSVDLAGCASAEFEVAFITVVPSEVVSGEASKIEVEVANTGGDDDTCTVDEGGRQLR